MDSSLILDAPVASLSLVGPSYATRLKKLGIETINDLIHHYPFRYDDLSLTTTVDSVQEGETVTLHGTIVSIINIRTKNGKPMQKAVFADQTGSLDITWFNQPYLIKALKSNPEVSLSGTIKIFRGKPSLSSPTYELLRSTVSNLNPHLHTGRLVPIYHETAGVGSKWLRSRIAAALKLVGHPPDWLPSNILADHHLINLATALHEVHFPSSGETIQKAITRLSFNELFLLQLAAQTRRRLWLNRQVGHKLTIDHQKHAAFIASLPFELTEGQHQALRDIFHDLNLDRPMNRLLQGDVGSGKTVVAAAALYMSFINHLPAALMAPTEVLALQHGTTIKHLLEPLGVTVSIQTKSQKHQQAADVYIGTHALLHRQLPETLGVIVIDEQHRFGVEQRTKLLQKPLVPNVLSMTATPIPRTIALTLYAELDISIIDELPLGRKPVKTWVIPEAKRRNAYAWVADKLQKGTQAFVVCPLIEDSPVPGLDQIKAAETEYTLLKTQIFPQFRVGLIHGRMSSKDKQATITAFAAKKLDLLVATPVIEVGIDIPGATLMLIEGAERFGLAGLHQLRGRVGRGEEQSYCLLFTSHQQPSTRLKYLETVTSGFKLAELDLKLRGPGDLYGTRQSGYIDLKIASLSDQTLITATHTAAAALIEHDPDLVNNPLLKSQLQAVLAKQSSAN